MAILDLDLNPPQRALRVFGVAACFVFLGLGAWAWRAGWIGTPVAIASGSVGALSLLFALIWPRGNRPLFIGLSILAWPIGLVVSYVVLGVMYFAVLTPLALVFRLLRRDALRLRPPRSSATYWVPYERQGGTERYFRQF